ncbi:hypothetical protein Tco_1527179 [Tanacetum coccineum]
MMAATKLTTIQSVVQKAGMLTDEANNNLKDTFTSLQALSNLHYLFSGFMDYLWSCNGYSEKGQKRSKTDKTRD